MTTLIATLVFLACTSSAAVINERDFPAHRIVQKDVAILGGGASGTYAAIRLREDLNVSVVVIERDDHIGGHVNTYFDPDTNTPINYGVLSYWDYGPARAFFSRMNVEVGPPPPDPNTVIYVDRDTAENLTSYDAPTFPDILESIKIYGNESAKYSDILLPGYWNFPSGGEIPPDLLLPFGEFAKNYKVENLLPIMEMTAGIGVGGARHIPTLYVMGFGVGLPACEGIIQSSYFVPKSGSNMELYNKAYDLLKKDIILSSSVIEASREQSGVQLVVRGSDGLPILIKAKQLLVTASPSISNLQSLDLDDQEHAVFDSGSPRSMYVGILKTSIIPRNLTVQFISPDAVSDNHLDLLKDMSWSLKFLSDGPEGSQLFRVLLDTNVTMSAEEAKDLIRDRLGALQSAGTFSTGSEMVSDSESCDLVFVAFADHITVNWRMPPDELRDGFIQKMHALQGHRATWYTGSLWSTDFSSNVWAFTDTVLERMMARSVETGVHHSSGHHISSHNRRGSHIH